MIPKDNLTEEDIYHLENDSSVDMRIYLRELRQEMSGLRELLIRAKREMIRVGNALNWDGEIANKNLANTINAIREVLEDDRENPE